MDYLFHLLIYFAIYAILALSLNLIVGYCGLITMAHAAFFAFGGYSYALLTRLLGFGFLEAATCAFTLSGIMSLSVSLPSWRFRGDHFVLMTLAGQSFFYSVFNNWTSIDSPIGTWKNLTNGPFGLSNVSKPDILGIKIESNGIIFVLFFFLLFLSLLIFFRLKSAPWGRLLKCMRDDELAVRALGKNTKLAKIHTLAIACAFAGLSGAMYSSYVSYIDPSSASLDESILLLSMVLIGGVGNLRGPMIGAAVLIGLPEVLKFIQLPASTAANLRLLAYGLLLMIMVRLRPQGLAGEYRWQ